MYCNCIQDDCMAYEFKKVIAIMYEECIYSTFNHVYSNVILRSVEFNICFRHCFAKRGAECPRCERRNRRKVN